MSTFYSQLSQVITYGFDAFQTYIGPGTTAADKSKNCQLHLNLVYPGGFQYAVVDATYHGWARLDEGVTGSFITTYYFSQDAGKTVRSNLSPLSNNLELTQLPNSKPRALPSLAAVPSQTAKSTPSKTRSRPPPPSGPPAAATASSTSTTALRSPRRRAPRLASCPTTMPPSLLPSSCTLRGRSARPEADPEAVETTPLALELPALTPLLATRVIKLARWWNAVQGVMVRGSEVVYS
jgi:hypothetical protein